MTTAKRRALLALLLLFCFLLGSCRSSQIDSSALHALKSGEDAPLTSSNSFEHDYLIIPASAGSELIARARTLASALSEQTGIPSLYFDDEDPLMRENTRTLLLGNVQNALSQSHLHTLRRDDYLCIAEENTLILGGKSDAATIAAINRFTDQLLPYADAEILINNDQHFTVRAEYTFSAATLNNFSLEDYRIAYPKNGTLGEKALAYALREQIADHCGFYPDILPDDRIDEQTRVIAIGTCYNIPKPTKACIYANDSCISFLGDSNYALSEAAQIFIHLLFEDTALTVEDIKFTVPPKCFKKMNVITDESVNPEASKMNKLSLLRKGVPEGVPFAVHIKSDFPIVVVGDRGAVYHN